MKRLDANHPLSDNLELMYREFLEKYEPSIGPLKARILWLKTMTTLGTGLEETSTSTESGSNDEGITGS